MSKYNDIGRDFNRLSFAMSVYSAEPVHRELLAILDTCLNDAKEYREIALENLHILQSQHAALHKMLQFMLQEQQFEVFHNLVQSILAPQKL